MARLEDKGKKGLPPPPAPPRRGANPWPFSKTARRRDPESKAPATIEDIFEGMVVTGEPQSPAGRPQEVRHEGPEEPEESSARKGSGAWPLFILLIAIGVVVKVVSQGFETGDWREIVAPLIAIAFIAHGWWRIRQRRQEKKKREAERRGPSAG